MHFARVLCKELLRDRMTKQNVFNLVDSLDHILDCEQSLFSSKIRGKERKASKHASVTVSVT